MYPAEETELPSELITLEVCNETNKAENIKHEGNESMVPCKGDEVRIHKDDMLQTSCQ